ncbi:MAG TPA: isopentenyl-diphosphate Delta-isomerase [Sedimenticola sp.]|nr:isopentenyl-diphosphate Delta-isomerase [Sedimenticola sp.]
MEFVTLASPDGKSIGAAEKLEAHSNGGLLHLAFSIFVFNASDELLLQKRALGKYHFAGLWSNTCCGHPRPHEGLAQAARRRLKEEFGFSTALHPSFTLTYEAHDDKTELTEKEFLHVMTGRYDETPTPDPSEIADWHWKSLDEVAAGLDEAPENYTPWFQLLAQRMLSL